MAYSKDKISEVRKSYIFDRLPLERCADLHEISYATVQRWKKQAKANGDDWDSVRTAHTLANGELEYMGREILTDFTLEFKNTMKIVREDDSLASSQRVSLLIGLADGFNKAISANKKILPQISQLATALQTIELLSAYIAEHKPDLLQDFIAILEPFGEVLERELK